MSPRKIVRRKYLRVIIAVGISIITLIGLSMLASALHPSIGPAIAWVGGTLVIVAAGSLALITVICCIISLYYWASTGYLVNPFRFGPWGDWVKGGLPK